MDAGDAEDAALLLAIKDAEISTLRQQMAQLTDDLKRNLAVLGGKNAEAAKLRGTIDALRGVLAEKDSLFAEFQVQAQELEGMRVKEVEARALLEQQLAAKQQEWTSQYAAGQQDREADVAALQRQLQDAQERATAQLVAARQAALDESVQRSSQHAAALQRATEAQQQLQQQVEQLESALGVKEAELQAAHRQLGSALESSQTLQATHAKVVASKEQLIAQLQQHIDLLAAAQSNAADEHESNLNKLMSSMQQMKASCETQAAEVQELSTAQKQLHEERRVLREQLRQQEVVITKLQTEKGVLEAALTHEVTAQAGAHAQLNIFQAQLTETVVELERRCSAAESRSAALMAQLVDERGLLVDAVVETANSSTPQLAAELAKSLEADRLRTQAELQVAQAQAKSTAEDLALVRGSLVPVMAQPAAGGSAAAQAANGALAALAQSMQRQAGMAASQGSPGGRTDRAAGAHCGCIPAASPSPGFRSAALGDSPCRGRAAPDTQVSRCSPAAASGCSDTAHMQQQWQAHAAAGRAGQKAAAAGGGSLSGLMSGLQADVDRLQQQLHNSSRQLQWSPQHRPARLTNDDRCPTPAFSECSQQPPARGPRQDAMRAAAGPGHASPQPLLPQQRHHHSQEQQQQHHQEQQQEQQQQLQGTLQHLLSRTERLTAENAALQAQLQAAAIGAKAAKNSRSRPKQFDDPLLATQRVLWAARSDFERHKQPRSPQQPLARDADDIDDDGASSVLSRSTAAGSDDWDLGSAAGDELAAAAAAGSMRRRQSRAAAASTTVAAAGLPLRRLAASHHHHHHPCCSDAASDDASSTCSGPLSEAVAAGKYADVLAVLAASSSSAECAAGGTKQLLESVLASWPANHKLGRVLKGIIASSDAAGAAASGRAASRAAAGTAATRSNKQCVKALAREQQLADMSPSRQRLLKALQAAHDG